MRILEHRPGGPERTDLRTSEPPSAWQAPRLIAGSACVGRVLAAFGVAYVVTMVTGFAAMGNLSRPLEDPYLAIMEVLILVMAPVLVLLAVVIHACAPEDTKTYSMTALGWMLLLAASR